MFWTRLSRVAFAFVAAFAGLASSSLRAAEMAGEASSSGAMSGTSAAGAMDGKRFSADPGSLWKGTRPFGYWQMTFPEARTIGAILQINGDDEHALQNNPRNYAWQISDDGKTWRTLLETVTHHEKRMFRIHRLQKAVQAKHIRLVINHTDGTAPSLREVEFYSATDAVVPFGDWIIGVSSLEDPTSFKITRGSFIKLARECEGWKDVPAQCIWHGDFDEEFVSAEPRPLCAFFSGSGLEWCQCSREPWRGVQRVLKSRSLPMWGACGGAQVFAILEDTGVDKPWDCPRCRDPKNPKSPIYSHIRDIGPAPCGDYSQCIPERGVFNMQIEAKDPVFAGLPDVFEILEGHVGQIDYVPKGWTRVVTKGPGALTVNQCLRANDAPIYSAQFHCEFYDKTPENSKRIMANFLQAAKKWGGYNPEAQRLTPPEALTPRVSSGEMSKN